MNTYADIDSIVHARLGLLFNKHIHTRRCRTYTSGGRVQATLTCVLVYLLMYLYLALIRSTGTIVPVASNMTPAICKPDRIDLCTAVRT
jgi:hypothetical protein